MKTLVKSVKIFTEYTYRVPYPHLVNNLWITLQSRLFTACYIFR